MHQINTEHLKRCITTGEFFANETLHLIEQFIKDAKVVQDVIEQS